MTSVPPAVQDHLRCPVCHASLSSSTDSAACQNAACGIVFPVLGGVPILLNEANSVFRFRDFVDTQPKLLNIDNLGIISWLKHLVPDNGYNLSADRNFSKLRELLSRRGPARVLVVGGGVLGRGFRALLDEPSVDLVETDVWLGPRTKIICDAHDIPFADASFDAVVAQAVLEHVADPTRCAAEIRRVLRPGGLVYAETPFMQEVHLGPYDFTRFTLLGHRRLFRGFDEIDSGAVSGPGQALMWSYESFLLGFTNSSSARNLVKAFARITSFFLKYFDYYLINRPAGLDGACAFYFLGSKSERELTDRELIGLYRGAQGAALASAVSD